MKKSQVKFIALSLLLVYSLAAVILCSYGYDLYAQKEMQQNQGIEKFHSLITGSMPGGAQQPEKQVEACPNYVNMTSKSLLAEFSILLRSADRFISSSFAQYALYSAHLPSCLYKTFIIFPFHYFW